MVAPKVDNSVKVPMEEDMKIADEGKIVPEGFYFII